jgi:hypothetical protein
MRDLSRADANPFRTPEQGEKILGLEVGDRAMDRYEINPFDEEIFDPQSFFKRGDLEQKYADRSDLLGIITAFPVDFFDGEEHEWRSSNNKPYLVSGTLKPEEKVLELNFKDRDQQVYLLQMPIDHSEAGGYYLLRIFLGDREREAKSVQSIAVAFLKNTIDVSINTAWGGIMNPRIGDSVLVFKNALQDRVGPTLSVKLEDSVAFKRDLELYQKYGEGLQDVAEDLSAMLRTFESFT